MKKFNRNFNHARFNSGFTMLEVLVAMVVLSVGLLSLAGLQVISLRTNHSSYLRTQATIQSYDIMDRMRVNADGVKNDHYDKPTQEESAGTENTACETSAGCPIGTGVNAGKIMAGHDLFRWNKAIADALPGGVGIVCIDSTPEDGDDPADPACDGEGSTNPEVAIYTVKIWWTDDQAATTKQRFTTSFLP